MRQQAVTIAAALCLTLGGTRTLTPADAGIQANPRFEEVAKKLDEGGDFYLIMDVKDAIARFLDLLRPLATGPVADPGFRRAFPEIGKVLDALGLYGLEAVGMSGMRVGERYRTKTFLSIPQERKGVFRSLGGAPHAFESLTYAPADAALFLSFDLDVAEGLAMIRQIIQQTYGQVALDRFNAILQQAGMQFELETDKAIQSLGGEFVLVGAFDPEQKISHPALEASATYLPVPWGALLVRVKDATIYDAVAAVLAARGVGKLADGADGLRKLELTVPPNPFMPFDPVLACDGKFIMLASHSAFLERVLAASKGEPNLGSQEEFQALTANLPKTGNGVTFFSARVGEEAQKLLKVIKDQVGDAAAGGDGPQAGVAFAPLSLLMIGAGDDEAPPSGMAEVRVNDAAGFWTVADSASGGNALASMAAVPVAIVAAIAVPNFLEAQTRAQVSRARADLRSVHTGLVAFFIDNKQYPKWSQGLGTINNSVQPSFQLLGPDNKMTLTTPIAYLSKYMPDPFSPEGKTYCYIAKDKNFVLWSAGPDQDYDLTVRTLATVNSVPQDLIPFMYDPTNGTKSSGDIMRTDQDGVGGVRPPRTGVPAP